MHLAHQVHDLRRAAEIFRREAAGNDERVELLGLDFRDCEVRLHRIAELAAVELLGGRRDSKHIRAGFAQAQERIPELELLILVLGEDGDLRILHLHSFS